jgi:hypothetical protein
MGQDRFEAHLPLATPSHVPDGMTAVCSSLRPIELCDDGADNLRRLSAVFEVHPNVRRASSVRLRPQQYDSDIMRGTWNAVSRNA